MVGKSGGYGNTNGSVKDERVQESTKQCYGSRCIVMPKKLKLL